MSSKKTIKHCTSCSCVIQNKLKYAKYCDLCSTIKKDLNDTLRRIYPGVHISEIELVYDICKDKIKRRGFYRYHEK